MEYIKTYSEANGGKTTESENGLTLTTMTSMSPKPRSD
jgi:hypothetical protein